MTKDEFEQTHLMTTKNESYEKISTNMFNWDVFQLMI